MSVVEFTGASSLDKDPARVLADASKENLSGVIVIGWQLEPDGSETPYFSSSIADGADVCWLMRHFELRLHLGEDVWSP